MTILEKTLSNLEKDIQYKCKDTAWNHLWTLFSFTEKYAGIVDKKGFKIWKYSRQQGIFYFTIIGKIIEVDGNEKLILDTKINKFAKTLALLFFFALLYFLFDSPIQYKQAYDGSYYFWHIDWKEIIRMVLYVFGLLCILIPVFYYVHRVRNKEEIENLKQRFSVYSNSTNQDYF
ncbi:hypothetical protein [Bernardetia sp. MNP-M8]|uniref:hypothetical protein n=1 Tax=Bernardetia sp. MNP-M8 TaxID=3127470 RepID=UPI0030D21EED